MVSMRDSGWSESRTTADSPQVMPSKNAEVVNRCHRTPSCTWPVMPQRG